MRNKKDMKVRRKQVVLSVLALCFLVGTLSASGQKAATEKPQMAEDVFKNVQVLRGISVDEFMGTMGFIAASLSMNCVDCHTAASASDVNQFAVDTPVKQTARKMILMVKAINQSNFGGKREVTCYSCHRGSDRPKTTPSLAEQYGAPPPEDPDEIEIAESDSRGVSAESIVDTYIQALGGADQVAKLGTFIAEGTYQGFDTGSDKVPIEIYAEAPNKRTTIVHLSRGNSIRTYDGRFGWTTSAGTLLPLPELALTGGDLDGAKWDAELSFPLQLKQVVHQWRADTTAIDDKEVDVIEGTTAGVETEPVKLYFDKQSGLLVRIVRYTATEIGRNPTQIDYSDYRKVAGVQMPFRWIVTWTDGQSTTELTEVQPNAAINAARFANPVGQ